MVFCGVEVMLSPHLVLWLCLNSEHIELLKVGKEVDKETTNLFCLYYLFSTSQILFLLNAKGVKPNFLAHRFQPELRPNGLVSRLLEGRRGQRLFSMS